MKIKVLLMALIWGSVYAALCQSADSVYFKIDSGSPVNINSTSIDSGNVSSVNTDTVHGKNIPVEKTLQSTNIHSPKKAGTLSAILPGLGQAYNRKYWKIPIVWAGLGGTGYMIYSNAVPMSQVKQAYIWISEGSEGSPPNDFATQYSSTSKLETLYNQYRYNIELFTIISIAWYGLNIIEAVVDAHLTNFDISEDLSMKIYPTFTPFNQPFNQFYKNGAYFAQGIGITINF
ncbi:MAG: DUF5683 domain-containing protein [Bacteroidales bacterium]|jgi:hypothetical protein|nr:DUF5683 domain-containing protein [Bacteroidales bacterium]MDD2204397.1 DUF5683 domain-containing protein [Bacteroidales bacterium]MDD3152369.1 DUF5683 domain-containing protein [Bacteroidales bacterium]MDD3913831.1 DUF5683 domain-containing protein [Bacteroidales bacterium]MDD4634330.1 DUF5683 domain-containing protein [Bacteroidales bacterium]